MAKKLFKGAGKLSFLRTAIYHRKIGFAIIKKDGTTYSITRYINKRHDGILKSQGREALISDLMKNVNRISSLRGSARYTILAEPNVYRDSATGTSNLCHIIVMEL